MSFLITNICFSVFGLRGIEFQIAEIVVPNPARDELSMTSFLPSYNLEPNMASTNRVIWGDNLLALQALLASGYEGKVELIYIDPPFWTGENYYASLKIDDTEITKSPTLVERLAYKDTWESGIDSYLDMMYPTEAQYTYMPIIILFIT